MGYEDIFGLFGGTFDMRGSEDIFDMYGGASVIQGSAKDIWTLDSSRGHQQLRSTRDSDSVSTIVNSFWDQTIDKRWVSVGR